MNLIADAFARHAELALEKGDIEAFVAHTREEIRVREGQ